MLGVSGLVSLLPLRAALPSVSPAFYGEFDKELDMALAESSLVLKGADERERQAYELSFYNARPLVGRPKPSKRQISDRAKNLIIGFEVINKKHYEKKFQAPIYPGGESGVTIGIGYDLGYSKPKWFEEDWSSYISDDDLISLTSSCLTTGSNTKKLLPSLKKVIIPWEQAYPQFIDRTLPLYVAETVNALKNTDALSDDCLGALVSLVYNRGASFTAVGERYKQMRAIRIHMAKSQFEKIPSEIRSMKEIWRKRGLDGLIVRRELEAKLFEVGMAK
ncbi:hypothetical protein [Pseudomonas chlororaphis]|uniref:hypothetical protein n=1 Tax=Pseudomonas chlororaphis TaxID=587753 RepID=UPI0023663DDE|nr:hypothetical protein [Pseudomonas chlororaphis]WDH20645.1 hypothetical protein PUP50_21870 [Pseudomonas chlororaphis]